MEKHGWGMMPAHKGYAQQQQWRENLYDFYQDCAIDSSKVEMSDYGTIMVFNEEVR